MLISLGRIKKEKEKKRKGGLYNTYHELLSEKRIVKRSWFHMSCIISPLSVAIFTTSHLEDKVDKSAVATSYQVDWIDCTLQNMPGQKCWQYKIQNANPLQWKSKSWSLKSTDLHQTHRFIENWSISTASVPYSLRFSQVH